MSVLRVCLSVRRRLGGILTCEHRDWVTMPACFVVALYPRAVPAFTWGVARGFCARERGCVAAIGVAVELFVDRVAVVVARGGGVL